MSKISRIRILNLSYNNNTIKIDDDTFDLGGESTLISLRNGGGKSVLVQMIISQFVNKSYRDFGERQFKSYFTTNKPTFIMTEWQLDNGMDRFLNGMMIRKNQKEDSDNEELEIYAFTGSYSEGCRYDMDNIPIVRCDSNKKILKGFGECKNLLEDISKDKNGDFRLYDMGSRYARSQYYNKLKEYQINNKEWESIIRKVNQKESGLSELFNNAKDEKNLVENWFLKPIEDKLNQDKNKIDEFRSITLKFVERYRSNQSGIERKAVIEKYFEDTKELKSRIESYVQLSNDKKEQNAKVVLYIRKLQETIGHLSDILDNKNEQLSELEYAIKQVVYEQISYMIYEYYDEKDAVVLDRIEQEIEITRLTKAIDKLSGKLELYDCNKIYTELNEYKVEKAEVDEKINVLLEKSEDNKKEIEKIGHRLYGYYEEEFNNNVKVLDDNNKETEHIKESKKQAENDKNKYESSIRDKNKLIGSLTNSVASYDETENIFNKEYAYNLKRNILGLYEDGTLEIKKKEMDEECQKERNRQTLLYKKKSELELENKNLLQEEIRNNEALSDIKHSIAVLADKLTELNKQKEYRLKVIRYIGLKESDIDNRDIIISYIDKRVKELDIDKSRLITKKSELNKKYSQLREGKTIEIPDNIKNYCEQNDISMVYGMEWLNRNKRTIEDNTRLVKANPFIPYSVIMERNAFERFKKTDEELYTSFPIPVIIKDELEKEIDRSGINKHITTYGNIHFFIMFNNHLLDKEELERMLKDIDMSINQIDRQIDDKTADINVFNEYRINIENQTFSISIYEESEKQINVYKDESTKIINRQKQIKAEKEANEEAYKENNTAIETCKDTLKMYERRDGEYDRLCKKYSEYESDVATLTRTKGELSELEKKQKDIVNDINSLQGTLASLNAKKNKLEEIIQKLMAKKEEYKIYSEADNQITGVKADQSINTQLNTDIGKNTNTYADIQPEQLEARFNALTKEVAENLEELTNRQKKIAERIVGKEKELVKKNKRNIPEDEYKNVIYSEEQYDEFEQLKEKTGIELNASTKKYDDLTGKISALEKDIQYGMKELKDKTGYEQPVSRKSITDTEFSKRINLKRHEADVIKKEISELDGRKNSLMVKLSGVSEYSDNKICVSKEKEIELKESIPDLMNIEISSLEQYQKNIRKQLHKVEEELLRYHNDISEMIRNIADKKEYEDDYFRKTFVSLLTQAKNPDNLLLQYETNVASYENQLEKLRIDLESIDKEQKNIEELLLEYIQNINTNIAMIDKNSTINVRGRNIKMLRIQVPDWESEKEHYRVQLHEYFDRIIRLSIDTIENNGNLAEFLGNIISTKNLYDDVVGIGNIKIKLYKIEAEKEVLISWADVSSNSGGEGFLSAFVILTCLLSYMRRDESDIFTTGEEGKVLIMDNPFAQTNAEHLLKPLMEMAKKTNTQLICLSGLGGDSIYNRFDNIYVLKLVDSNIRSNVQRVEGEHIKGDAVKKMTLSEFRIEPEQMNMFDMQEDNE